MPRLSLSWLWQPLTIGKKQPPCKRLQQDKNDKCFFGGDFWETLPITSYQ